MALIETINIKKIYGTNEVKTVALGGVSLLIDEGEFLAIMGPSGSGKSTLMHILGLLDRPTSGIYKFKNQKTDEFSDKDLAHLRNKEMGFIFQAYNLLPRVNVLENTKLPLIYNLNINFKEADKLAMEALDKVGLTNRLNYYPNQLSGGEQQRVAIARALVNNPKIIFADEPTGNLDSKSGKVVMEILQDLNNAGHTIILVTHENYTARYAKRIIYLKDGLIVGEEIVKNRNNAKVDEVLVK